MTPSDESMTEAEAYLEGFPMTGETSFLALTVIRNRFAEALDKYKAEIEKYKDLFEQAIEESNQRFTKIESLKAQLEEKDKEIYELRKRS